MRANHSYLMRCRPPLQLPICRFCSWTGCTPQQQTASSCSELCHAFQPPTSLTRCKSPAPMLDYLKTRGLLAPTTTPSRVDDDLPERAPALAKLAHAVVSGLGPARDLIWFASFLDAYATQHLFRNCRALTHPKHRETHARGARASPRSQPCWRDSPCPAHRRRAGEPKECPATDDRTPLHPS